MQVTKRFRLRVGASILGYFATRPDATARLNATKLDNGQGYQPLGDVGGFLERFDGWNWIPTHKARAK